MIVEAANILGFWIFLAFWLKEETYDSLAILFIGIIGTLFIRWVYSLPVG